MMVLVLLSSNVFAMVTEVHRDVEKAESVKHIRIVYKGCINSAGMTDLISTLDKINLIYINAQGIEIYLNSRGGDMDSGYMGYNAILGSRIPVTTVNAAMVGSAASLLYCAGQFRHAFAESWFILHPAGATLNGQQELKPDALNRLAVLLSHYNGVFSSVYRVCSNLNEQEMKDMLSAEYLRKDWSALKAQEAGFVSEIVSKPSQVDAIWFIQPDKK
ncbi:ATP-dependent Clp protease proteolytic subunit [Citrobacter freundii]|uniref:ATP-dependent Clp protease proteolytic subunit n=1 Tax=Citrobacter freundii TaxID=546 RepID=UPI001EF08FA7|nr:ATP-dependent Clp protease proteolytic subunit [Citrobacter freundii]